MPIQIAHGLLADLISAMRDHNEFPLFLIRHYPHSKSDAISSALQPLLDDVRIQLGRASDEEMLDAYGELDWYAKSLSPEGPLLRRERDAIDRFGVLLIARRMHRSFFDPAEGIRCAPGRNSRVYEKFPELEALHDKDGLLRLNRDLTLLDGGIVYKGHLLHYHQFLRRGFGSNPNFDFVQAFSDYREANPELDFRIAIDHRRLLPKSEHLGVVELDYWWGPPTTASSFDDLNSVGLTVHGRATESVDLTSDRILRTEFFWSRAGTVKTIEIEEVRPPTQEWDWVINRYVHAERDTATQAFRHFDGAAKLYSASEYNERVGSHLPNEPRASPYIKLFRIDGSVTSDDWSKLLCLFFRGNEMVVEYVNPGLIARESSASDGESTEPG